MILKKTLTQAITSRITCQGEVVGMMKDEADRKIIGVLSATWCLREAKKNSVGILK